MRGFFTCLPVAAAIVLAWVGVAHATPAVEAGRGHNVAVTASGQAWAWGDNGSGQLGNGNTTNSSIPVRSGDLANVVSVAAGGDVSAALLRDGSVWVWGQGPAGQQRWPAPLPGITGAKAIAAGGAHVLVLMANGTVRAWGANDFGQLGNGTVTDSMAPVTVSALTGVTELAAGDQFSLALRSDGSVWAWGVATHGELGIGASAPSTCPGTDAYFLAQGSTCARTPMRVSGITAVSAISARGRHALAVRSDGSLWAWGSNHYGQLGDGTQGDRFTPAAVPGMTGVQIVAAGFSHSAVRRSDGSLWTWGLDNAGQLGVAATYSCANAAGRSAVACVPSPARATAYPGAAAVSAGGAHTMVVRADGSIAAFGHNGSGQLGSGLANGATTRSVYDPHAPFGIGAPSTSTSLGRPSTAQGLDLDSLEAGLDFATQAVGTRSAAIELWFTNIGDYPVKVLAFRAWGNFAVEADCRATLEYGDHCNLFVAFAPTLSGVRQGTLEIETDSTAAPVVTMALTGLGDSAIVPANYSDMWWNPDESGWGLTISDHETTLFAVWFTYESNGRPTWYFLPEGKFGAGRRTFTGPLYATTGPCYTSPTFDTALVRATPVGTASLDFAPADLASGWARFSGTMGGRSWSKAIARLPFGNASTSWGGDYTDIWWNADESGWGLTLAQHGDNVFGVLFTYDCDGTPLFITLPGVTFAGDTAFLGDLYTTRSSGSWWGSATFDPAHVTSTPIGKAWLTFSGRSAMFTTLFGSAMRTRTIVPQPFGHAVPGGP